MTDNPLFTTGQTEGLTGLSLQQIQRYVRTYPQGFTQEARKPKKGRRFTGADIKSLLLIRHLLHTRRKQFIPQALSGEWTPPDSMVFEVVDFMTMYQAMRAINLDTIKLLQKVEAEKRSFERHTAYLIRNLRELRGKEWDRNRRVRDVEDRMKAIEKRLPKQQYTPGQPEAIKKKSLLDKWLDSSMNE